MSQGVKRRESSAEAVAANPELTWLFSKEQFDRGVDVSVYPGEGLDKSLMSGAVFEEGVLDDFTIGDIVALISGFGSSEYEYEGVVSDSDEGKSPFVVEETNVAETGFDELGFDELGFFYIRQKARLGEEACSFDIEDLFGGTCRQWAIFEVGECFIWGEEGFVAQVVLGAEVKEEKMDDEDDCSNTIHKVWIERFLSVCLSWLKCRAGWRLFSLIDLASEKREPRRRAPPFLSLLRWGGASGRDVRFEFSKLCGGLFSGFENW